MNMLGGRNGVVGWRAALVYFLPAEFRLCQVEDKCWLEVFRGLNEFHGFW
jgi:hypothetical protein